MTNVPYSTFSDADPTNIDQPPRYTGGPGVCRASEPSQYRDRFL